MKNFQEFCSMSENLTPYTMRVGPTHGSVFIFRFIDHKLEVDRYTSTKGNMKNFLVIDKTEGVSTTSRFDESEIFLMMKELLEKLKPEAKKELMNFPLFRDWFNSWEDNYDLRVTTKKYGL